MDSAPLSRRAGFAGRVSVAIPEHSAARCPPELLESALAQACGGTGIVVADGGSADDAQDVLAGCPPVGVASKDSGGLSSAPSAGIGAMAGGWLKKLDADDVLHPDRGDEEADNGRGIGSGPGPAGLRTSRKNTRIPCRFGPARGMADHDAAGAAGAAAFRISDAYGGSEPGRYDASGRFAWKLWRQVSQ